jgi:hypothetical protein
MRALAALSAAVALLALWSVERAQLTCDLQLAAELSARPGETIALRALVFCDLDAPAGPRLVTPDVLVRLLDEQGRELSRESLAATGLDTLDGQLTLPHVPGRAWTLEASARHEGQTLVCRRALRVEPDAGVAGPLGREAGPLQQYALGRVRATGSEPAPSRMLPRVVGGACVPEQACRVLIWVGTPAAAIRVRSGPSLSAGPPSHADETEGLVAFELTVHGPEAELTFEAQRAGKQVAERALRLPVALGEVALLGGPSLIHTEQAGAQDLVTVAPPPGRAAVTVDGYSGGRWASVRVRPAGTVTVSALLPAGSAGLVRLQGRSDRFGNDGTGARQFFVRPGGLSEVAALSLLARTLEQEPQRGWLAAADALEPGPRASAEWAAALPAFATRNVQDSAAFLLAPAEGLRVRAPVPASGRPEQLRLLERTRVRMRYGVAGALALSAWLIALSIARRGLLAVDQAQAIMLEARARVGERSADAGSPEPGEAPNSARERINARAKVLLMVLAVAAAFLAGALLIAAKSLWF